MSAAAGQTRRGALRFTRRPSGGAPPRPPSRAPARRVYHPDRPSSPRCPMVATDSTLSFPDRRVAERRGLPARRSGLDRRGQNISVPLERRRGGERRTVADRRSWTERRRATATIRDVPAGGQMTGAPRTRKFEVDRAEYPFADRWLERGGSALHYVDEGAGPPVLMLHGNPTWSFLYRNVIKQLGGACRSIAPHYPGFGLSDPPPRSGYTPPEAAQWIPPLGAAPR